MPLIFYARGDSSSANNAALNAQNTSTTPVTTLEFQPTSGGDVILDYNSGLTDPDTTVLINGTSYNFTMEFSGTLPVTNKLGNVNGNDLRSEEIAVITVQDYPTAGEVQRLFFLTNGTTSQATMNSFPNGAHAIGNVDTTTNVVICFARGTLIRTPDGEVPVEQLKAGDMVMNSHGQAVKLIWVAKSRWSGLDLILDPTLRPIRIAQNSFGEGLPYRDLDVSPRHRVILDDALAGLFFGQEKVMVPAKFLSEPLAQQICPADGIEYYHLLLKDHDVLISNGLETESFQPGRRAMATMAAETSADYFKMFSLIQQQAFEKRHDAYYSLKSHEAQLLLSETRAFA